MDNQSNKQTARIFADAFAPSLAQALTQAVGSPLLLKVLDSPDLSTRHGQPVHFRLTADGALHGECFVEFYEPQVADLGSKLLGEPAAAFREEHSEALAKVISSATAELTALLSAEYGELTFKVDRIADLAFGRMLVVPMSASMQEQPAMSILLYFDGQFLEALTSQGARKDAAESGKPLLDTANLKMVMDVELNVSLRFGQRQLPLREVLDLASGSVIELDRQVDDPVELLLDGKVIARGEAVIVDGNYGLRVTEVPQPIASHI